MANYDGSGDYFNKLMARRKVAVFLRAAPNCWTIQAIADHLGIAVGTVHRDLKLAPLFGQDVTNLTIVGNDGRPRRARYARRAKK